MAETLAESENLAVSQYDNGRVHVYEVDPETGKKTHISHDKALEDRGYDPADSAANYALKPPEAAEAPTDNSEIDTLRSEMLELMRQMEVNNERRHQELMAVLQALVEQKTGTSSSDGEELPAGAVVGDTEDEGMDRMRTHFSMLDGEEGEGNEPPVEEEPTEELEPTAEQKLAAAEATLSAARNELVIYTIRRRGRAGDGLTDNRREDKESYDTAMTSYKEALQTYLQTLGEKYDGLNAENPEQQMSEEEIQRELLQVRYAEQLKFKEAEFSKNNELLNQEVEAGGWRKLKANVLRKWANYSTKKKLLIGLGVGAGAALVSGTLGLGLAAIAAGSAAKFSLGLLNRSASARNVSQKSYEHEVAHIESEMQKSLLKFDREIEVFRSPAFGRESQIGNQTSGIESDLDKDVSRAQWHNRIGNAIMLLGGTSAAYGIAHLAGAGNPDFNLWPFGGGHHGVESGPGGPIHTPNEYTPISLHDINPNTITAHSPTEFQHGVLRLLNEQGVHAHGVTPEKLAEMNHWMQTHQIASGMRADSHGLEQNLTNFPGTGQEFTNAHVSAAEGFRIGVDGTGRQAMDEWIRHAEKVGIHFERTK